VDRALRILGALAVVGAITYVDFRLVPVNSTTVALTFLLAVLGIAARWGLPEAVITALAATLCFNFFFLPPIGTFTIGDPENWVALLAFLVTAIVASQLSTSARKRAEEALRQQHEMERLYEFSRMLILAGAHTDLAGEIPNRVVQALGVDAAAFFDRDSGRIFRAGASDGLIADGKLKDTALQGTVSYDGGARSCLMPVSLGGHVRGSLAIVGGSVSETAAHALANLVAITLEREAARESASRAEAAQESEKVKSTLLDALAHEFQTPLNSIKAAATALLRDKPQSSEHTELLAVVEEESGRLSDLVTEAIHMARIEAGQLHLQRQPVSAAVIVDAALKKFKDRVQNRRITVQMDSAIPPVEADEELVSLVLQQLLDNALKYSPQYSPLEISAREDGGSIVIGVADNGPGIPEHEQTRIFEKFYRGDTSRESVGGTGIGLTIASEIVKAHGGRIWVHSRPGQGATFWFSLPLVAAAAQA
jgi:two-component system, OmpR family, sensor histidine kinase KdpD